MRRAFARNAAAILTLAVGFAISLPVVAQSLRRHISESEFALIVRWVRADQDQRAVMRELYDHYAGTWRADYLPDQRALNKERQALMRERGQTRLPTGEQFARPFREMREKLEDFDARLKAHEDGFFDAVAAVLRDEQIQHMDRVTNGRKRVLLLRNALELPEGPVDLVMLVDMLELADDEYDHIESEFITEYEPRYITTVESSIEAKDRENDLYWGVYDLRHAAAHAQTPEEQTALAEEARKLEERLGRSRLAAVERVLSVVRQGKARLLEMLPEEHREEFEQLYLATAYPEVYPDALDAGRLYEAALAIETLDGEQIELITVQQENHRREHDALSEKMARGFHNIYRNTYGAGDAFPGERDVFRGEIAHAGLSREELNLKQDDLILLILREDQRDLLPEWEFAPIDTPRKWDDDYESERQDQIRIREFRQQHGGGGSAATQRISRTRPRSGMKRAPRSVRPKGAGK